MNEDIDIGAIRDTCTCLRARRAARQLTQRYDRALAPVRLTVNQFGLLAHLDGSGRLSIGALADAIGKHPSTVNRDLRPLTAQGLIAAAADPADRRVRALRITAKGSARLRRAMPLWRQAQAQVQQAIGPDVTRDLNDLLDLASARLKE
jgi:DNA-binding MarR family transcriptional regulator